VAINDLTNRITKMNEEEMESFLNVSMEEDIMDKPISDYTIKDLFKLNKSHKLEAIKLLIDSIADDKGYEAKAFYETEFRKNFNSYIEQ